MQELVAIAEKDRRAADRTAPDHRGRGDPRPAALISAALLAVPGASAYFLGARPWSIPATRDGS